MSRYAINEPDPFQYDASPVDVQDEPRDGEPWPSELGSVSAAIDPAEHVAHAVLDAFQTLECEMAKCSTVDRALALRRICGSLYHSADRLALASTDKLNDLAS